MANSIASPDCNKAFRRVRLTPAFTFSTFLSGKRFPEGALAMDSRLSRRGFLRAAGTAAAAAYATRLRIAAEGFGHATVSRSA